MILEVCRFNFGMDIFLTWFGKGAEAVWNFVTRSLYETWKWEHGGIALSRVHPVAKVF